MRLQSRPDTYLAHTFGDYLRRKHFIGGKVPHLAEKPAHATSSSNRFCLRRAVQKAKLRDRGAPEPVQSLESNVLAQYVRGFYVCPWGCQILQRLPYFFAFLHDVTTSWLVGAVDSLTCEPK